VGLRAGERGEGARLAVAERFEVIFAGLRG
jgi:hypothetical protein